MKKLSKGYTASMWWRQYSNRSLWRQSPCSFYYGQKLLTDSKTYSFWFQAPKLWKIAKFYSSSWGHVSLWMVYGRIGVRLEGACGHNWTLTTSHWLTMCKTDTELSTGSSPQSYEIASECYFHFKDDKMEQVAMLAFQVKTWNTLCIPKPGIHCVACSPSAS